MNPIEISDALLAFPADVKHLMPSYDEIPDTFKKHNSWSEVFSELFYNNNKRDVGLIPVVGIDPRLAWRHLSCVMRSYQPKHEHKTAACCYLLDMWFVDALLGFTNQIGEYESLVTGKKVTVK